jgi:peroxiredoxin (alkyl hydroperoxide reductase subunit C)
MMTSEETLSPSARSLPRLSDPAPDFTAETTHGPLTLASLRGKWVVLFSHPADFTPVCTTELVEFARQNEAFQQAGAQLIGLSIDSVYAHLAWVRSMEQNFGLPIPFPIIADSDMKVAHSYGMIHAGASSTAAVRCVFIIDAQGIVRAMIYYPLTVGRNVNEILRLVRALQVGDANGVSTPANWQPGDPVLLPAPRTTMEAENRLAADAEPGVETQDWYLTKRTLPAGNGDI